MNVKKEGQSKRQIRRDEIRRKERQQRITLISVAGGVILLVLAALIVPSIIGDNAGADDFTPIQPGNYPTADGTTLGDPNAPVKIEVFEDFQCSACETYTKNYEPAVIANLVDSGQVYYVFYQYPFLDDRSTSKDSDQAAMAAMCAADQNRFWDFKNLVFANRQELPGVYSEARLTAFAESLDLDMDAFRACYRSNSFQSQIDEQLELGKQMGVTGTPSVFVNGVDVSPGKVPTYDQILAAVQAAGNSTGAEPTAAP